MTARPKDVGPMARQHLLIVAKRPAYDLLTGADRRRLDEAGVVDDETLRAGREAHHATLQRIRRHLGAHRVTVAHTGEVGPMHVADCDLVIAVGGDGTALSVHQLLDGTPLLAVNSDPGRSVGHYTRCTADSFDNLFDAWLQRRHRIEELPRLQCCCQGHSSLVLNDCLISNPNPGAMSRYRLQVPDGDERQHSSGIWISTATGSTGAIASAGMDPVPPEEAALLYLVREPFEGRGPIRLRQGLQRPPAFLQVTAGLSGLAAFIDGHHDYQNVPPGGTVRLTADPRPLRLVAAAD